MSNGASQEVLCAIARTAFETVSTLLRRDQKVARELRTNATGSRQIYREESITEHMLSELVLTFPDRIKIELFTVHEETPTGADWYWRFEKGGGAIHAYVQAKRVRRTKFEQPDALGHIVLDRAQLRQLVSALTLEADRLAGLNAWLATYARCDAAPPCASENLEQCKRHRHTGGCPRREPSVWIANASEILSAFPSQQRIGIQEVVRHSVRLDCILPCSDHRQSKSGPGAKGFVLQEGLPSFEACVDAIRNSNMASGLRGAVQIHD